MLLIFVDILPHVVTHDEVVVMYVDVSSQRYSQIKRIEITSNRYKRHHLYDVYYILTMKREEIIDKIKAQNFPKGSYVVFGSGPLAAAGIRPTRDIDLLVSSTLYSTLQQRGWRFKDDPDGNPMLYQGEFEVSIYWRSGQHKPSLEKLLETADVIDGVPFVSLEEVKIWKKYHAREKDIADIELIENYQTSMDLS